MKIIVAFKPVQYPGQFLQLFVQDSGLFFSRLLVKLQIHALVLIISSGLSVYRAGNWVFGDIINGVSIQVLGSVSEC